MGKKTLNRNLQSAKTSKKDEFYTQRTDIERELKNYHKHFKGKIVYCNCDDPRVSNFFHYFSHNFEKLGLKKLITTCYKNQNPELFSHNDSEKAIYLEYTGDKNGDGKPSIDEIDKIPLKGDGDFRSQECIELLKKADIVVTNPPFSLFREYIAQLVEYKKKFLILGDQNAVSYKEIFKLVKENKIWFGVDNGGTKWFGVQDHYDIATESRKKIIDGKKYFSMGRIVWYTNLDIKKRHEELILCKKYNKNDYPNYDNYDAINIDRYTDIPFDYEGVMGVPITFLNKFNPEQFEILGITDRQNTSGLRNKKYTANDSPKYNDLNARSVLKTNKEYKALFPRILIRNKKVNKN